MGRILHRVPVYGILLMLGIFAVACVPGATAPPSHSNSDSNTHHYGHTPTHGHTDAHSYNNAAPGAFADASLQSQPHSTPNRRSRFPVLPL